MPLVGMERVLVCKVSEGRNYYGIGYYSLLGIIHSQALFIVGHYSYSVLFLSAGIYEDIPRE